MKDTENYKKITDAHDRVIARYIIMKYLLIPKGLSFLLIAHALGQRFLPHNPEVFTGIFPLFRAITKPFKKGADSHKPHTEKMSITITNIYN